MSVTVWSVTFHPEQAATSKSGRGRKSGAATGKSVETPTIAPRGKIFRSTGASDFSASVRYTAPGEELFTAVALVMDSGNRISSPLLGEPVILRR